MNQMRRLMQIANEEKVSIPRDTTLDSELVDDVLVEMANLPLEQTGVKGIIFVSTAMGQHGPRVKYFVRAGRTQPSFSVSIGPNPRVVANSLPERVLKAMAPRVIEWVTLNEAALLQFWNHGDTWMHPQVNAFFQSLKRLS